MLDKLTYSGNPANLDGTGIELVVGDICDAAAVAEAAEGATRSPTSPPRRTSTAPFSAPSSSSRRRSPAPRCSSTRRAGPASGSCRSRPTRSTGRRRGRVLGRERPAQARRVRTASRRPAATCRSRPTRGPTASTRSITRGSNTYGPNQYPEKLIPLMMMNAIDDEPLPVYGDGGVRDWLWVEDHCAGIELVLREGAPGRSTTSAARGAREPRDRRAHPRADRGGRSLVRHVEDRPGTTAATRSTRPSCGRSAGAAEASSRASRRPSRGTSSTAAGGSRSSPASTASTTTAVRGQAHGS